MKKYQKTLCKAVCFVFAAGCLISFANTNITNAKASNSNKNITACSSSGSGSRSQNNGPDYEHMYSAGSGSVGFTNYEDAGYRSISPNIFEDSAPAAYLGVKDRNPYLCNEMIYGVGIH